MLKPSSATNWFICHRPKPKAKLRLFCFPYAGGGTGIFHGWSDRLPWEIEIHVARLPGREARLNDPPFNRISTLVAAIATAFDSAPDKPFATFGHSMGAVISFELARRLRSDYGLEPQQMIVSGCRAPQLGLTKERIYDLPELEFIEKLSSLNGTPRGVLEHPEMMQLLLPMLRADFEAVQTYSHAPEQPFDCPITALGGLKDNEVAQADLEAWREHTRGEFKVRMLPGDHFFLHSSQAGFFHALTNDLRQVLSRIG